MKGSVECVVVQSWKIFGRGLILAIIRASVSGSKRLALSLACSGRFVRLECVAI